MASIAVDLLRGGLRRQLALDQDDTDSALLHGTTAATPLTANQQQILQAFVLVSCSMSFIGLSFVILHYVWERIARRCCSLALCRLRAQRRQRQQQQQPPFVFGSLPNPPSSVTLGLNGVTITRDFNALLVFILSWIDLASILARMVGRTVLHEPTWCVVQASVIHAASLASCLWTTCISFNLYRWIVFGESDKKRRARLLPFLLVTFLPSTLLILYPLRAHKYGNATFYCWLKEPVLMFVHFYVYYVVLAVLNVALLLLIRVHLKPRVQWHDSDGTDATAAVIRRKALHYILIFLLHRVPILLYRALQMIGLQSFAVGVAVQFVLNLDGFSNAVVYGGLFKKIPGVRSKPSPFGFQDPNDPTPLRSSSEDQYEFGSGSMDTDEYLTSKDMKTTRGLFAVVEESGERTTDTSVSSLSAATTTTNPMTRLSDVTMLASPKSQPMATVGASMPRVSKKRRFGASILDRASIELGSDRVGKRAQQQQHTQLDRSRSYSIFVSTFNMGEQNIADRELVEWIPIGHEIYVIGVQECMNLGDLQTKILQHLVATTKQKYIHFSREIGKRATALGYHGYIALTVFVLEEAIHQGRFEMPHRDAMSKQAQEVYRGKSLLLFGRASNKGAVGLSFRYNNTSFAFVTCHLASDSAGSSKKLSFRKQPSTSAEGYTSNSVDGSVGSSIDSNDGSSRGRSLPPPPHQGKPPPSKVERRNQDAMEILQQLYLDEEDYGFGFPHLHHHSFVLGDLNYRMTRQYALPKEMIELLGQAGVANASRGSAVPMVRSLSGVSSARSAASGRGHCDVYEEATTPTMARPSPDLPAALGALIRDHDELTMLRESSQLFYGFDEAPITFFPTFRRIRGEQLNAADPNSFGRNYSLMASGGGLRVPSYTDRILHASLPGRTQQVQCLYYDSCESVTSSDHKPVCAVFRVGAVVDAMMDDMATRPTPPRMRPRMPSLFGVPPVLRRKDSAEAACDVVLKVEFRSIRWMDAVDIGVGNLFSRLENVEVGFLFPLPCEDVLSQQRKLQQVAANLNWGESIDLSTPLPSSGSGSPTPSTSVSAMNAASPNFHVTAWNTFVEQGLRYQTRAAPTGKKHVALMIRTRSRAIQRTASSSRSHSRSRTGSSTAAGGAAASASYNSYNNSTGSRRASANNSFTSSSSYELSLGHGAFCIEKPGKRQDTVVPLTMGGNLVGWLHLRVTLQARSA